MRIRRISAMVLATFGAIMLIGCAAGEAVQPNSETRAEQVATEFTAAQAANAKEVYAVNPVNNSSMEAIRSCNREPGSGVLLSYDDEGSPEEVMAILSELRKHNVQAAFFPTGDWALAHLDLIKMMKGDGHIVGNHTQTHARLGVLSAEDPDTFYAEIFPLEGVTNTDPMWIRPPYEDGSADAMVQERLTEKGMQMCTWTADTYDWNGATVDEMMQRLTVGDKFSPVPLTHDGVVLMHMDTEHAVEMIGTIVSYLESQDIKVAPLL